VYKRQAKHDETTLTASPLSLSGDEMLNESAASAPPESVTAEETRPQKPKIMIVTTKKTL